MMYDMDDSIIKEIVLKNKPIITLGDEINIRGILGENSTDSIISNDEFKSWTEKIKNKDERDLKLVNDLDHIVRVSSDFAAKYESLARSIVDPVPVPVAIGNYNLICPVCDKIFPDRRYLNRHLNLHTSRYSCPHCQKVFSRKESKLKHIPRCKVVHPRKSRKRVPKTPVKRYVCDECCKVYTRKSNYEQHTWKHKHIAIACETCHKMYSTTKSLRAHQKLHQSTREFFFCEHCSAIFLFKSNLRRHMRKYIHTNLIICEKCHKKIRTEKLLEEHRNSLTIKCILCSEMFCLEKELKSHRKYIHPNSWFKCNLCDPRTRFMTRSDQHLREHTRKSHSISLTFNNCYEVGWFLEVD